MPRSLCASKREIKETVISSAASAPQHQLQIAASQWQSGFLELWRGSVRGKNQGGRVGEEKGQDGAADCRVNSVIQGFTAVRRSLEREVVGGR